MAKKFANRKITYHVIKFIKKKTENIPYNDFDFNDFVTWFNTLPPNDRLYDISNTKFTSLDTLEIVSERLYEGLTNAVFGMMSTGNQGSRRNLKHSKNNNKRHNPKELEEGEEQENYFLLAFRDAGNIEMVYQNSSHSTKSNQFKNYLEKFIIKYLSFKKVEKEFDVIEGSIVEEENIMLDKLDRITKTKLYIDKSILDDELGLSDRTLNVREDLILEVSAKRNQSLREFFINLKQNALYRTKVDKLWVEGKDSNGNISSFYLSNIQKRTYISFEINPFTAELLKDDVQTKLLQLI